MEVLCYNQKNFYFRHFTRKEKRNEKEIFMFNHVSRTADRVIDRMRLS